MKTLVLFDSQYGNTQQIAQVIANQLGSPGEVALFRPAELPADWLAGLSLLVVGSPTQRFRATPALTTLFNGISKNALKGVKGASFDTRLTQQQIQTTPVLKWFVRKSSYAAWWLSKRLQQKGAALILPPEGFYVAGMEGPLLPGELERAAQWAQTISNRSLRDT